MIQCIIAGFAGNTSLIKSDSIIAASSLLKHLTTDFSDQLLNLVLVLVADQNREIYKSVLKYVKTHIGVTDKDMLRKQLPNVL